MRWRHCCTRPGRVNEASSVQPPSMRGGGLVRSEAFTDKISDGGGLTFLPPFVCLGGGGFLPSQQGLSSWPHSATECKNLPPPVLV